MANQEETEKSRREGVGLRHCFLLILLESQFQIQELGSSISGALDIISCKVCHCDGIRIRDTQTIPVIGHVHIPLDDQL
jgi:hypothetical protein